MNSYKPRLAHHIIQEVQSKLRSSNSYKLFQCYGF
jgi:hypothetical protein